VAVGIVLVVSAACAAGAKKSSETFATASPPSISLPNTGWPKEKVTSHLLNRLAFGASAADRARLTDVGAQRWVAEQLTPAPDPELAARLERYPAASLSVAEAYQRFPPLAQLARQMRLDLKDDTDKAELRAMVRPENLPRELLLEASAAKLTRAVWAKNQLEEVLVDFWFNHFNVSAEKGRVRWMVAAYEREAIRPFVFGKFENMLLATARHPAMLFYLDNWLSSREGAKARGRSTGLNENYARELLELHTLGVDAGYTQNDVREAARALTGWSIELRRLDDDFGEFAYRDAMHDKGEKEIFGLKLEAGRRMEDGAALLHYLAHHPKTAQFLATKLCRKFVADVAPAGCVERVAAEFLRSGGDLHATYVALFTGPEFWSDAAFAQKTKTPLEFVASAIRATAELREVTLPLGRALNTLGQPLYRAQPPTGWPETADAWVNAGALVSRINFGLALARGQVRGTWPMLPAAQQGDVDATIDRVALTILGAPPSESTRATLHRALAPKEDEVVEPDVALIAGLLLGSPEFQKQ
jgi:uncharacterized protein (DUF1800 family)